LYRALEKKLSKKPYWSDRKMGCNHGDMNQKQRDRVFADLRAGTLHLLVATDVVGRGIDVSGISHIINYDIPQDCDDYVHRVGRTGRMGRDGIAFTFVSKEHGEQLTAIEQRINRLLIRDNLLEELRAAKAAPVTSSSAEVQGDENPLVDPSMAFKVEKSKPKSRLFPMRKPINERLQKMKGPE
jgi:ATP-dependent RNA helicase DeaD